MVRCVPSSYLFIFFVAVLLLCPEIKESKKSTSS